MLKDPYIRLFYGGVIALDQLPSVISKPSVYIVNTDPAHLPGTHWLAVYFDSPVSEHFDSSGQKPPPSLELELIFHSSMYMYNTSRVQSFTSNTCGEFSLFFCYFRCRGFTFKEIMNMFTGNLEENENLVQLFYNFTK